MPELEITPHPEQQRTYAELREEFQAESLSNLRSQFSGQHPLGWNMIGDSFTARDRYTSEQWCHEMLRRLDDPVTQDFGLGLAGKVWGEKLEKQAAAALAHDSVTWDEGEDQDAPSCRPILEMTDDEIANYVDQSIKDSAYE